MSVGQFIMLAFTAVMLENALFARALDVSVLLPALHSRRTILCYGGVITVASAVSGGVAWLLHGLFQGVAWYSVYGQSFLFLTALTLLYAAACTALYFYQNELYRSLRVLLTTSFFNCAALGSMFLAIYKAKNFLGAVGVGAGIGLGFLLACLLVRTAEVRLAICNVPKAFQGLPIRLMYIGLLALATYGLVGHQLPV
ncbi:MAG: Rnf-Nqr domain containing protein [Oscillospiraceae bacterium]|nr:Rnf-Nqr domain containing protein [Oscillospiraceae bacterium]